MTTNEGRCEPGPGAKPMTHHWVGPDDGDVEPWLWDGAWMRGHQYYTAEQMRARGWVYSAPCVEPATVAALVEALEGMAGAADHENWHLDCVLAKALSDARAALAAYREAGR